MASLYTFVGWILSPYSLSQNVVPQRGLDFVGIFDLVNSAEGPDFSPMSYSPSLLIKTQVLSTQKSAYIPRAFWILFWFSLWIHASASLSFLASGEFPFLPPQPRTSK